MKKVGVALLGLGVVGSGTYKILQAQHDTIKERYGVDLEVMHVLEKDVSKAVALGIDPSIVSCDINNVINDSRISVVAEFFGGVEPAKTFLLKALQAGKSIVTANKEMFSKSWSELEEAGELSGAGLYFEASCVGGVPVIRALQESMQGNTVLALKGIVNGTTNYILSKMSDEGAEYASTLKEAQRLGYAELNPSADVDGFDSSYKLSILSTLAYGKKVPLNMVYREGIANISKDDIDFGKKFGYTVKLIAGSTNQNGVVEAHVYPAFISDSHPLANVKGSFNALYVVGNNVGDLMFYGRGAGDLPTGSAIVSDIVFAATREKHLRYPYAKVSSFVDEEFNSNFNAAHFVRVEAAASVQAAIAQIFADAGISLTAMSANCNDNGSFLIFVTAVTDENSIKTVLSAINAKEGAKVVSDIRIEG